MAIDTRAKRQSALNFGGRPWVCLPEADGSIDQDDRQHMLMMYGGILVGAVAETILDFERGMARGAFRGLNVGAG